MKQKSIFLILLLVLPFIGFTQDGSIDTSFGNNGYVFTDFFGRDDSPKKIVQQSDDKIIVIGRVQFESSAYSYAFTRYYENGDIDFSFGDNGVVFLEYDQVNTILILDDDKMIVGGTLGNDYLLIRYLPDGTLDASFGNNGIVTTSVGYGYNNLKSVVLSNDGKIIVIGYYDNKIILNKYFLNGDIDTSFGDNGYVYFENGENIYVFEGEIQNDGKIIVSGKWTNTNYTENHVFFIRFLENGTIDTSFGDNGVAISHISPLTIRSNYFSIDDSYRIVAAYSTVDHLLDVYNSNAYRILPNGGIDITFGEDGYTHLGNLDPRKVIIQPNNRILFGGGALFWEGANFSINRLYSNGGIDSSFTQTSIVLFSFSDFILLNNGKILGLGNTFGFSGDLDFVLTRYKNNPLEIEEHQLHKVKVYPNPSKGIFKISHGFITSTPYQITDITGKIIQTGKLSREQSVINLTNVTNGVYFFNSSNNTLKLVKK